MEHGPSTWGVAIRLAITWSLIAAATAVAVAAIGDVPETVIVLSVIVGGFGLSWVRTGHTAPRGVAAERAIRVSVRRTHPVG